AATPLRAERLRRAAGLAGARGHRRMAPGRARRRHRSALDLRLRAHHPAGLAAGGAAAQGLHARRDAALPRADGGGAGGALMEQWILLAMAPVFLGLVLLEAWYWKRRGAAIYAWRDTLSNAALAL